MKTNGEKVAMGKKKKDANIINIDDLVIENKIEIDYDKLAKAIIKANQLSKEEEKNSCRKCKKRKRCQQNESFGAKRFLPHQ